MSGSGWIRRFAVLLPGREGRRKRDSRGRRQRRCTHRRSLALGSHPMTVNLAMPYTEKSEKSSSSRRGRKSVSPTTQHTAFFNGVYRAVLFSYAQGGSGHSGAGCHTGLAIFYLAIFFSPPGGNEGCAAPSADWGGDESAGLDDRRDRRDGRGLSVLARQLVGCAPAQISRCERSSCDVQAVAASLNGHGLRGWLHTQRGGARAAGAQPRIEGGRITSYGGCNPLF